MSKALCLGTAKLGMPTYGYSKNISNSIDKNKFILDSLDAGVCCLDTSPRYGNSEKIVGTALKYIVNRPFISTKIDNLKDRHKMTIVDMEKSVKSSINKIGVDVIDLCYLHQNEINILSDKYVHEGVKNIKDKGLVKYIGASVYSKEELKYVIDSCIFDWVQVPVNILDTSFYKYVVDSGSKIKITARSIYLQGILFDRKAICSDIKQSENLINYINRLDDFCKSYEIDFIDMTMSYLNGLDELESIIVGTTSIYNLKRNVKGMAVTLPCELIDLINEISEKEKSWTNPRYWHR